MVNFPMKDKENFLESRYDLGINWKWTDQIITLSLELYFYAYEWGVYFQALLYYWLSVKWHIIFFDSIIPTV